MMQEAERLHLIALSASEIQSKPSRFLIALGDALICVGKKLKKRYAHKAELQRN